MTNNFSDEIVENSLINDLVTKEFQKLFLGIFETQVLLDALKIFRYNWLIVTI